MNMMKGPRTAVVAVVSAVAASVCVLPASPASAATQVNACVNSLITTQASRIPVEQTATASPNPVSPGGTVTLSNISQTANIPPGVALTGYRSFVLSAGAFSIPVAVHTVIEGTNVTVGTQTTNTVSGAVTGTITDPTGGSRNSGDESATVDPLTVNYNDQTWTAGASGTIDFREDTVTPLSAVVGDGLGGMSLEATIGPIVVNFACSPGEVVEGADPSTITFTDPALSFASSQIAKCTKLQKQLKKAKKAKNKKKVKKIRKELRKLGC